MAKIVMPENPLVLSLAKDLSLSWFDRLTMSGLMSLSNAPLILSLAKDLRLSWFDRLTMSGLMSLSNAPLVLSLSKDAPASPYGSTRAAFRRARQVLGPKSRARRNPLVLSLSKDVSKGMRRVALGWFDKLTMSDCEGDRFA